MLHKIFPILSQYIKKDDTLIVGVSGGSDSTALLLALIDFYKNNSLPVTRYPLLVIAHVNHGIRGKAADSDEKFVRNLAKKFNLKCHVKRVKLKGNSALEERGREIRRDFFESLLKKHKARYIITAHTEDDQLETIIFNFLRGSGPRGLAGMRTVEGVYFKPMLRISKAEILAYLKEKKQPHCHDKTNRDTHFSRNYIRAKILPLLMAINPSFRKTLLRNQSIFAEIDSLLCTQAAQFLREHHVQNKRQAVRTLFPLRAYKELHPALQRAVIQEAYREQSGASYALPLVKIMEVERLLARSIGGKKIICGGGGTFMLKKGIVAYHA